MNDKEIQKSITDLRARVEAGELSIASEEALAATFFMLLGNFFGHNNCSFQGNTIILDFGDAPSASLLGGEDAEADELDEAFDENNIVLTLTLEPRPTVAEVDAG
jgi:hypothetical protein